MSNKFLGIKLHNDTRKKQHGQTEKKNSTKKKKNTVHECAFQQTHQNTGCKHTANQIVLWTIVPTHTLPQHSLSNNHKTKHKQNKDMSVTTKAHHKVIQVSLHNMYKRKTPALTVGLSKRRPNMKQTSPQTSYGYEVNKNGHSQKQPDPREKISKQDKKGAGGRDPRPASHNRRMRGILPAKAA